MTKTSSTRHQANATCTASYVTCRTCWGSPLRNCMPSWVSSLIQKTEVPGTTLSWPRGPGTEWEIRPDPLLQRPMGGQDGTPLGVAKQQWPSFIPCLFHKANSPVVEEGMASLSLARPGREDALGSHPSTEQAVCRSQSLRLFEVLQGASMWMQRH